MGQMLKRLLTAIPLTLLVGCATAYQSMGLTGGYSDTRLGKSVFRVDFRGNGYTSAERTSDLAMLRGAELALRYGYSYFVVAEAQETTNVSTYAGPEIPYAAGDEDEHASVLYMGTPPRRPRSSITIACFVEKPGVNAMTYDARSVADSIRKKYRLRVPSSTAPSP
ncbi:MAG: hypothetical protein WC728_17855 [Elusimicrobiota bacterium]